MKIDVLKSVDVDEEGIDIVFSSLEGGYIQTDDKNVLVDLEENR